MLTKDGFTFSKCIVCVGRSDLRKGIDGLASVIRLKYNLNPLEPDTLFLFCGTKKDRLKGLLWCGDRFILLYIRLVKGFGRFSWPRNAEEARQISAEEFIRLMDGFSIDPGIGTPHQPPEPKTPKQLRSEIDS